MRDRAFPALGGEQGLHELGKQDKATGPGHRRKRRSYQARYRRLLPPLSPGWRKLIVDQGKKGPRTERASTRAQTGVAAWPRPAH